MAESITFSACPHIELNVAHKSRSLWIDAWQRLLRNKAALVALVLIAVFGLVALFAPLVAPYSYEAQDLDHTSQPPTTQHLMGTDQLGRDVFSRLVYGARIS